MRRVLYLWVPHLHTAVERRLASGLLGQPVVVAAGSFARGVVVDASPEAEALGAGAGQSWRHARRHAPAAVFIPYEKMRYRPFTERIGDLLHELTPWVETLPGSEEEFFADLGAGPMDEGEALARGAITAIREALGLEARAGVATGKLVARTAVRWSGIVGRDGRPAEPEPEAEPSGYRQQTPLKRAAEETFASPIHGGSFPVDTGFSPWSAAEHLSLTPSLPPGAERRFLRPLSLDYLWDMPPEHRRRLGPLGLRTFGQLAAVPQRMLVGQFGPVGRWYRLLAAGIDARRVKPWAPHPTVSSRLIIEEDPADLPLLDGYLELLARRVSDTLIATGQYARVISLMLETDAARPFASRHLKAPTNLAEPLRRAGHDLLVGLLRQILDWADKDARRIGPVGLCRQSKIQNPKSKIESLTLIAGGLETRGVIQLSLFGDPDREPLLRAAIARIQDRFGEEAIVPAGRLAERLARLRHGPPDR
jgi:nucleotidyltransferase/DNA polymerase involved in DNA repair